MLQVLTERQAMHAKEPAALELSEARDVPSLAEAAHAIPNVAGLPAPVVEVQQVNYPIASGAGGPLSAWVYRPGPTRNTPAIIFFPGGTWASSSFEAADETARELAVHTGWIVVMIQTRLAPEAVFPAMHDDADAAYRWARSQLRQYGGDPTRVVLAGEGPGANLALATALRERNGRGLIPDYLLLITPWAGTSTSTPSMSENADYPALTRRTVRWAQDLYVPDNLRDTGIDLASRQDYSQMPPTLIILAEIDPLRSSGETLAARMAAAGVPVQSRLYRGSAYGFFGLGTQVPEAAIAEQDAARIMRADLVRIQPVPMRPRVGHRHRVSRSPARQ
jgi:acetyl esterase/lipase